jgi:hypothetical protein
MMREILFQGKDIISGEWVTGFLVDGRHIGSWLECEPVNPDTVGQFTGLTDMNGKKIFEGDMFHLDDEIIAVVIFKDGCFRLEEYGLCGAWTESGFDECGGGWGLSNVIRLIGTPSGIWRSSATSMTTRNCWKGDRHEHIAKTEVAKGDEESGRCGQGGL